MHGGSFIEVLRGMKAYVKDVKGVVYAVVSSATFGLIPLFSIPLLSQGYSSQTILCFRFLVAAAIMAVVMLISGRNFRLQFRQMLLVVVL